MKNFFSNVAKWFVGLPKKTQIISAVASGVVLVGSVTGITIATAHRHEYLPITTSATCLEQGYTTYQCECGDAYVDNYVAAKGHTGGDWIVDAEATCTEDGSKHQICSVCDATIKTETLTKLGHTDGEWIVDAEATCTEDGSKHQICSVCDATIKTETLTKLGHTDGDWIVDAEATCTEDGSKHQICSVCDATIKTETLSKIDHSWKNATCTTPKTCSTCNATSGIALGHSWKNATCTTPKTCSTCNTTSGSALGHSWKNATCTTPKTCSTCNATSGTALGHSWKNATCTAPKTCSTCNITSGSSLGHSWKSGSCTTAMSCSKCGKVSSLGVKHTWSGKSCSKCGKSRISYYSGSKIPDFGNLFSYYLAPSTSTSSAYYYDVASLAVYTVYDQNSSNYEDLTDIVLEYIDFLESCGFKYYTHTTSNGRTILMYYNTVNNVVGITLDENGIYILPL